MVTEGHGKGCFDVRGKGKTSIVARSERFQVQLGGSNIIHGNETQCKKPVSGGEGMGLFTRIQSIPSCCLGLAPRSCGCSCSRC